MSKHPKKPLEPQEEEMREEIADKIQRMRSARDDSDHADAGHKHSEADPQNHKSSKKKKKTSGTAKKKKSGSSKKKMKQKKRRFDLFPRAGDPPFEVIRKCIFLMSSTIFVVCMVLIGQYFWDNYQNAKLLSELEGIYDPDRIEPTEKRPESDDEEDYEYYGLLPTVSGLLAQNPEITGWLKIPDTVIDYPVLQHRIPEDGNSYYLTRNFKREYEKAGSIFMDYRDNFDFVVGGRKMFENSQNLIIYGHNMHDYSMFGSLKRYVNEPDFYDSHPIVYLNSNYRRYRYKIFAMIIVDVDDETDTKFDYWNTIDFADEQEFYDYVNEIKRRTVRLTDVDITYGDQLLTLSTCNSTFSEGRLVVFARLLRDGEELTEGCTSQPNPNIKWPNSYYRWHKKTYDPNGEFVPYG